MTARELRNQLLKMLTGPAKNGRVSNVQADEYMNNAAISLTVDGDVFTLVVLKEPLS